MAGFPGKEQAKLSSDAEIDRMFDQFQSSSNETIAFGVARCVGDRVLCFMFVLLLLKLPGWWAVVGSFVCKEGALWPVFRLVG